MNLATTSTSDPKATPEPFTFERFLDVLVLLEMEVCKQLEIGCNFVDDAV